MQSFVATRTIQVWFRAESFDAATKHLKENIDLTNLRDDNEAYRDHSIEDVLTCEDTGDESCV